MTVNDVEEAVLVLCRVIETLKGPGPKTAEELREHHMYMYVRIFTEELS